MNSVTKKIEIQYLSDIIKKGCATVANITKSTMGQLYAIRNNGNVVINMKEQSGDFFPEISPLRANFTDNSDSNNDYPVQYGQFRPILVFCKSLSKVKSQQEAYMLANRHNIEPFNQLSNVYFRGQDQIIKKV